MKLMMQNLNEEKVVTKKVLTANNYSQNKKENDTYARDIKIIQE
jgi:hypothetical protein